MEKQMAEIEDGGDTALKDDTRVLGLTDLVRTRSLKSDSGQAGKRLVAVFDEE
jgi:hypothetical protein